MSKPIGACRGGRYYTGWLALSRQWLVPPSYKAPGEFVVTIRVDRVPGPRTVAVWLQWEDLRRADADFDIEVEWEEFDAGYNVTRFGDSTMFELFRLLQGHGDPFTTFPNAVRGSSVRGWCHEAQNGPVEPPASLSHQGGLANMASCAIHFYCRDTVRELPRNTPQAMVYWRHMVVTDWEDPAGRSVTGAHMDVIGTWLGTDAYTPGRMSPLLHGEPPYREPMNYWNEGGHAGKWVKCHIPLP